MRWSLRIGTIAGIRVELHVTFLLFVVGIALYQGVRLSVEQALTWVALVLLVFLCVLLHELGHALTARRYGIKTLDIVLLPIGGVARLQRMPEKPQHEMLVAIAGPAVNVVIVILLSLFTGTPTGGFEAGAGLLQTLIFVNVIMVVFNLIPAFPMDGGRVLRALLAMWLPYVRATRIASSIGQGIALVFGFIGLFTGQFMLMLIALFVFLAASEERAVVESRASMAGIPVSAAMLTDFRVLGPDDPLQRAVDLLVAGSQQDFPIVDAQAMIGILTRADLARALQSHGAAARIGDIVQPEEDYAEASEPLEEAIRRMREHRRSALPVLHMGALVGLLTLENVSDLLIVRDALKRHVGGRPA